ncbi:MAG: TonB-dependent receptor [Asticcacaulis sp.]|uniref:TonB-dependent receptor n=1 Tax=Asticcacaulis sp. TaxID=1872648 RepID=UPI003F7C0C5D
MRLTAIMMAGLGWAAAAHAQTTEVVVRANRFDAYSGDAAFSAIDAGAADMRAAPDLDTALKRVAQAELFRRSSSNTANPTVQGVGLRALAPSGAGRALVTLDGVPQNDPFGNWVIWAAIPQMGLSHAHIVRGAGGGAYGAGALTGVIDLDLTPPQALEPYLRVEGGEHGNGRLDAGGALGDLAVYGMTQSLHGDAPIRGGARGAADVATFSRDAALSVNYQRDLCPLGQCGRLDLLAGSYDSRRDTGLAGASATARGDSYSLSFTRSPTPQTNGFRAQIWRKTSDLGNVSVSVADDRSATALANDQVKTPATGTGFNLAIRHQTPALEWEIGSDGRFYDGESREFYRYMARQATRYRVSGGRTSDIGLYGEATRAAGAWRLTAALRGDVWRTYDGHRHETDLTTGAAVLDLAPAARRYAVATGRLGLTRDLSKGWQARAAAYTGFRPPSLNELYRPFRVGNDVTEANADLKPEQLKGVEIGVRHSRTLDADLFWNVVDDPIGNVTLGQGPATFPTAGYIPAGGSLRERRNVGRIRAWGLEARGDWPVAPHLNLTLSGVWTHARIADAYDNPQLNGLQPAEAPDYTVSLGLDGGRGRWRWAADAALDGRAFDDDLNQKPLKPSQRLDLTLDYAITNRLTLEALARNAFDSRIAIANRGGLISYDTGRRVSLALIWR